MIHCRCLASPRGAIDLIDQREDQEVEDGDLSHWPLSPDTARHLVRVRFVKALADLLDKFRDLYVRSAVVKKAR